jgi:hypothetical protein
MLDKYKEWHAYVAMVIGMLGGAWAVTYLFHLGPDISASTAPWWSFPYYLTALVGGFVVFLFTAASRLVDASSI